LRVLEVLIDGDGWTVVDSRSENSDLNGRSLVKAFGVSRSAEVRFFRLRQTGANHHGGDAFRHCRVSRYSMVCARVQDLLRLLLGLTRLTEWSRVLDVNAVGTGLIGHRLCDREDRVRAAAGGRPGGHGRSVLI